MRTVTRKLARHYLTRKLNDDLKRYESERLSKGIKASSLVQQYGSTQFMQTTTNEERNGTKRVALKEQMKQHVRRN